MYNFKISNKQLPFLSCGWQLRNDGMFPHVTHNHLLYRAPEESFYDSLDTKSAAFHFSKKFHYSFYILFGSF